MVIKCLKGSIFLLSADRDVNKFVKIAQIKACKNFMLYSTVERTKTRFA